eukprot:5822904-Pleurochrysis_carterae.AAC.1
MLACLHACTRAPTRARVRASSRARSRGHAAARGHVVAGRVPLRDALRLLAFRRARDGRPVRPDHRRRLRLLAGTRRQSRPFPACTLDERLCAP